MDKLQELLSASDDAWIDALMDDGSSMFIREYLDEGMTHEEIGALILERDYNAAEDSDEAGSDIDPAVYYRMLVKEVEDFLCGSKNYSDERKKLSDNVSSTQNIVVSSISAAIAPLFGASAPVIAPVVVVILLTVGRLGLNAWCATCREKRNQRTTEENSDFDERV